MAYEVKWFDYEMAEQARRAEGLKRCPFCGGAAKLVECGHAPDVVECQVCGVSADPDLWNQRA